MGMVEEDGVYRSARRRVQRRKKIAVGLAGLAAVLAGGGWAVSAWHTARQGLDAADLAAPAPTVATSSPVPSPGESPASPSPSPSATRSPSPRLSGARQSSRPSPIPAPTPSPTPPPTPVPDEEVAAAQISRLVQAPVDQTPGDAAAADAAPPDGAAAAGGVVVVANEAGADGSAIRVLSARHDLGRLLWAADGGRQVGGSRCTQSLRIDGGPAQSRPGMLLCWRVSAARSVVTVATRAGGSPLAEASARVLDRTWRRLD